MRRAVWAEALADYLAAVNGRAHAWGAFDCALFVAGAVEAMTGDDPAAEFRGRYRSEAGAKRALRAHGQGTLVRTLDAKFEPVHPAFAGRGDIAMHEGSAGIVTGEAALFAGESDGAPGLIPIPRGEWSRAWRV